MKLYYVDTNVFLRYLLKDNPQQCTQAEELFEKAKNKKVKLVVPQIILFEIQFVLSRTYRLPKQEVVESLSSLLAVEYFHIQNKDVLKNTLTIFEGSTNSLVDCFLFVVADRAKAELFTFDKKLKNLKQTKIN